MVVVVVVMVVVMVVLVMVVLLLLVLLLLLLPLHALLHRNSLWISSLLAALCSPLSISSALFFVITFFFPHFYLFLHLCFFSLSPGAGSTGVSPDKAVNFCPKCGDCTLQSPDHWFWMPNTPIKSLTTLKVH
jgi:hypothetical protein